MYKTIFTIDGIAPAYIGYTSGRLWNGWATPHFKKSEALRVMEDYNKNTESPIFYNEEYDTFYHFGTDNYSGEMWKGEKCQTEDGIKILYGIGAYCWVWDAVNDGDRRYLAQQVEEFIYYHDTYHYWDEYDTRREQVVNSIAEQFQDLNTFHKAICIMRNEELTEDARFEKLGGVLNV